MAANYGGTILSQSDAQARSSAYWGPGVRDGDKVDIKKAQGVARERFLNVMVNNPKADVMLPLEDLIDPALIRKAIFDPGYSGADLKADIRKAQSDFMDDLTGIRKATDSTSSLIHPVWDSEVVQLFKRLHPIQALIDVEACTGKWAIWDAVGPTGNGTAFYGGEDPTFSPSDMQPSDRKEACKIAYTYGKVTKMAQFAGDTQTPSRDMMGLRTEMSNEALRELKDRGYMGITRDVSQGLTQYEAAPPLAFPGLYELITNNTTDPNWVDVSGETVNSWATLEPLFDQVYLNMLQDKQMPNLVLTDYNTFAMIRRAINQFFMSENMKTTEYGISVLSLNFSRGTLPMIPLEQLPAAHGTNGTVFMLDTTKLAYRQLWGPMFELLANTNGNKDYMVSEAGVLIDKSDVDGHSSLQGMIKGITI